MYKGAKFKILKKGVKQATINRIIHLSLIIYHAPNARKVLQAMLFQTEK
jgi:hypothetical protein